MSSVGFLGRVDAEVDFNGLEVPEVDGGGRRWVVHEVASGVDGSSRNLIRYSKWVKCEDVVVK